MRTHGDTDRQWTDGGRADLHLLEGLEPLLEAGGQHEVAAAGQRGQLLPEVRVLAQGQVPEPHVHAHGPQGPGVSGPGRGGGLKAAAVPGGTERLSGLSALHARPGGRSGGRPWAARIPQAEAGTWLEGGGGRAGRAARLSWGPGGRQWRRGNEGARGGCRSCCLPVAGGVQRQLWAQLSPPERLGQRVSRAVAETTQG